MNIRTPERNAPAPSNPSAEALAATIDLPAGHLPCVSCGVAVSTSDAVDRIVFDDYRRDGRLSTQAVQPAARCRACAVTFDTAHAVIRANPQIEHVLGGVAHERLIGALSAFDLLGTRPPAIHSAHEALQLVEHLPAGAAARFAAHAVTPGTCASSRWAHVPEELRSVLRASTARWLKATTERPVPIPPPVGCQRSGCLYCGVGSVVALPSAAGDAWREVRATPRTLGGTGFASEIAGAVCSACARAIDLEDGRIGRSSMQRALLSHLAWRPRSLAAVSVELEVVGWGAKPAGGEPNPTPWAHIDLAALRADLEAAS